MKQREEIEHSASSIGFQRRDLIGLVARRCRASIGRQRGKKKKAWILKRKKNEESINWDMQGLPKGNGWKKREAELKPGKEGGLYYCQKLEEVTHTPNWSLFYY